MDNLDPNPLQKEFEYINIVGPLTPTFTFYMMVETLNLPNADRHVGLNNRGLNEQWGLGEKLGHSDDEGEGGCFCLLDIYDSDSPFLERYAHYPGESYPFSARSTRSTVTHSLDSRYDHIFSVLDDT